jgi:hypothetical protein
MGKYKLISVDSACTNKARSVVLSKFTITLFLLIPIVLLAGAVGCFAYNCTLRSEIAELSQVERVNLDERPVMSATMAILSSVVDKLYQNDDFAVDIFEAYCVQNYTTYARFARDFTSAKMLDDLLHLENTRSYGSIPHLMRYTNMIYSEMERRSASYQAILDHLELENVIFNHTPSIWPSPTKRVTSHFGFRRSPFNGTITFHEGTDLAARVGTDIYAGADGVVVFAGTKTGYGYLVTIDHGFGYMTRYAHNSKLLVRSGDIVKKGGRIALSGQTGRSAGPHSHYEVLYNGTPVNAINFIPVAQK